MRAALRALVAAFAFLTAVPIRAAVPESAYARAPSFFPLVGAAIGLCVAFVDIALSRLLPLAVASVIDLILLAALSGGLHLDGLADSADGLLLVGDPERRLAAMADSRTGVFGVAALALVLLLEAAALSSLPLSSRAPTLVAAAVVSRWSMTATLALFPSAKPHGLAASFKQALRPIDLIAATGMALVAAVAALGVDAVTSLAVAASIVAIVGSLALARIGGMSGDVCGAVGELAFAGQLVLASATYR